MYTKILLFLLVISTSIWANFNFSECLGAGTFEQQIEAYNGNQEKTVDIGDIPKGIKGFHVELISDKDVDIRLYGATGDKIVHWPKGILNNGGEETKPYKGVNVTYSGFNGKNGHKGHEYIDIASATPTGMSMKAFGYKAGYATVNYSWTGKEGCTPKTSGTGDFTQEILKKDISLVGTIPPSIKDVEIKLTSNKDLDIQLYGVDGTAIVAWPKGLLSKAGKQSIDHHGMKIEWSGFDGTNGKKGNEYIKITGKTTEMLVMKVYGFEAGNADVTYKWGNAKTTTLKTLKKVYNVNETISVIVDKSLLTGKDDRVGVYRKNDKQEWDWDVVRKWQWITIANTYQLTLGDKDLPAGEYEIRLYTDFNSHSMPKARYSFKIGEATNLPIKTLKKVYNVNEIISVTVDKSLLTGKDDRVGVYRKNDKQEWDWDVVRKWQWITIANTYQLTLGDKDLPAGEYEIRLYTDFSSHSMPKASYAFSVGGGNNNYVYGSGVASNEIDNVVGYEDETNHPGYFVYYPKNHIQGAPLVLVSGYKSVHGYNGLMKYLASQGCYVVGHATRLDNQGWNDIQWRIEDFEPAVVAAQNLGVDTSRLITMGSSTGGMVAYPLMKHFKEKGYATENSIIIDIQGWYAQSMTKSQLVDLNSHSLIIALGGNNGVQQYSDGSDASQDPRVLLTLSKLMSKDKSFHVIDDIHHSYAGGEYADILAKENLLAPIDAMIKYEFFNDNGQYNDAETILFDQYDQTIQDVYNATMDYVGNDGNWKNGYYYPCVDKKTGALIYPSIDYCNDHGLQ